jgi:hypothetical protein
MRLNRLDGVTGEERREPWAMPPNMTIKATEHGHEEAEYMVVASVRILLLWIRVSSFVVIIWREPLGVNHGVVALPSFFLRPLLLGLRGETCRHGGGTGIYRHRKAWTPAAGHLLVRIF